MPPGDVYGPDGLVNAILSANQNPGRIICLSPNSSYGLSRSYEASSGLPVIRAAMTIKGFNATITRSGSDSYRIMQVQSSANLTMEAVTLSNGLVAFGAGIQNYGSTNLNNVRLTGGTATSGGGGIHNVSGSMTISNSRIEFNNGAAGGGIFNDFASANLNISYTEIRSNTATVGLGGGLHNLNGSVSIDRSSVVNNSAFRGGGISSGLAAITNVTNSLVGSNSAQTTGGGVAADGSGIVTSQNCIIDNNALEGKQAHSSGFFGAAPSLLSNWWGASSGPQVGDIAGPITYTPYLTSPANACAGRGRAMQVTPTPTTAQYQQPTQQVPGPGDSISR